MRFGESLIVERPSVPAVPDKARIAKRVGTERERQRAEQRDIVGGVNAIPSGVLRVRAG
jgi:hypothetical protein